MFFEGDTSMYKKYIIYVWIHGVYKLYKSNNRQESLKEAEWNGELSEQHLECGEALENEQM